MPVKLSVASSGAMTGSSRQPLFTLATATPILSGVAGHPHDPAKIAAGVISDSRLDREIGRVTVSLGEAVRTERRRRHVSIRELAALSGLGKSTIQEIESGDSGSVESYVRLAHALGLRPEFDLVDLRRRDGYAARQVDLVHAALVEAQAEHFRRLGFNVRLDEPYQHYQFAGRADLVAWSRDAAALLHIEDKTELNDVQDAFGSFNAKRAYLGAELAARLGIGRWRSETHVVCALWSADVMRSIKHHRASFEAVCPDSLDAFEAWWSGRSPTTGKRSILLLFDPVEGRRSDRRRMVGLRELEGLRPRYRDYAEAAERLRRLTAG